MSTEKKAYYKKDKDTRINPKEQLLEICKQFMTAVPSKIVPEVEVRFGTKGFRPITKIDFDNVIKKIKSLGFTPRNPQGSTSLKIEPEFLDIRTGGFKTSNVRVEINGINEIQRYCRTNDLESLANSSAVTFIKKGPIIVNEQIVRSADFDEFNFRVAYSGEENISKQSKIGRDIIENWPRTKKSFRFINRIYFVKEGLPFTIDMSIVKNSSRGEKGFPLKTFDATESKVFTNQEHYEIEIEVINNNAKIAYSTPEQMVKGIELISKYILCGLQRTNYPISYTEQNTILHEYMKITQKEKYNPTKRIYPSNFIGPSSVTLQTKNIAPINPDVNIPNIRKDYVVTEKADGERSLLFISVEGKIYLISSGMSVTFTGTKTNEKACFNSILDGELILHDKNGKFINLYAAFDIYFMNGDDIRALSFMPNATDKKQDATRFQILKKVVGELKIMSIVSSEASIPLKINTKRFYPIYNPNEKMSDNNIFDACNFILKSIQDGKYEYNTDGLIFTHMFFGVGSDKIGQMKSVKTWEYSFKWKPAEYNTIDFLISTKKATNGDDVITPIFENGLNTSIITQFTQYKTLILQCGFDENRHGYINPCQDVLDDKLPHFIENDQKESTRRPMQFFPSVPYDPTAGLCNIVLEKDKNGTFQMFTEEREVFTDNMIVEFRYDMARSGLWRWIPLRVRYDKTSEYRRGIENYGNDYTTANNNWYSIHNPVTKEMITTGENIPDELADDDIYYNRTTSSNDTKGLRDFHNLFVKKMLIQKVANRGNILIDYACGKGGDFPKWISANLSFVFGVDLSKDNLENRINGACARFLNYKKEFKNMPSALFVNGNSSLNIRSGEAMLSDKAVQITKAVFGQGNKEKLDIGVKKQYGRGEDGFDISSCQFAIHYMFENAKTLHNFIRNISECTKVGGYFIGTSYDGKTIFNKLKKKSLGEDISIYEDGKKIWQIIKEYNNSVMEDTESCLSYKISVYQESINKVIPEYLVNFDYLNRIMEDYGFVLLPRDEAKKIGLPEGSGMFVELFNQMVNEIKKNPIKENEYGEAFKMRHYEKEISFLNRYFVYKKIRNVDAYKIANSFINISPDELEIEKEETQIAQKVVKDTLKEKKPRVKKLKSKLLLVEASESPVLEPDNKKEETQGKQGKEEEEIKPTEKKTKTTKTRKIKNPVNFELVEK